VPILNARFALYGGEVITVFILASLYSRNAPTLDAQEKPLRNILTIGGNVLLLCALTLEVNTYFDQSGYAGQNNAKQFAISALWGIYSIVVIVIGIAQHYQPIRLFALTVFSITIFKVFLGDMSFLDASYRILSFIGLGVILLIASYIYQRYQAQIREFTLGE